MIEPLEDSLAFKDILEKLNKIHQEANESRIKLELLKNGYIGLAQAWHLRLHDHKDDSFKTCDKLSCKTNRELLDKLGLSYDPPETRT